MKDYFHKTFGFLTGLSKTPRGKAILFFGFYFFFFLFLTIFLRSVDGSYTNMDSNTEKKNNVFSVEKVNGKRYHFLYSIGIDSELYTLTGLKVDQEESFDYTSKDIKKKYFRGLFAYFEEETISNYRITTRPLEELLVIDNADALLENASYESKTEYSSGKVVYRYSISSSTIERIAYNRELDVADEVNEIIVTIQDERITNLEFNLDSYGKTTGKCEKMMRIVCQYSDFDTTEEIVNPMG
ncbi:MAG: hypothetical protein IJ193_05895 [Bacilli bacterium]|nr:hypothetical protein [Bacilli bacterium]